MANVRALTRQLGIFTEIQNTNSLIVGAGIDVGTAGALAIGATTATSITLNQNTVVQAGATLSTTGSGNINVPNNGSARFNIEGSAVSANVTATNLNTLTDGVSSTTLHTHPGLGSATTQLLANGLTLPGGITAGLSVYVSANGVTTLTDNLVAASSKFLGMYNGTASTVVGFGLVAAAKFTTVGGSPSAGAYVYLAASTDEGSAVGKLTATEPATAGTFAAPVGICVDNSSYAGAKTCIVWIQPQPITAIN